MVSLCTAATVLVAALALGGVRGRFGAPNDMGPDIVPKPAAIAPVGEVVFTIDDSTAVALRNKAPESILKCVTDVVKTVAGVELVTKPGQNHSITLTLDSAIGKGMPDWQADEAYRLAVAPNGQSLDISARSPHGLFNGIQTLRQSLQRVGGAWQVPAVVIDDHPRFRWRGYLIDPARHFRPKPELLRIIDLLAMHKLNVLHMHLTDDQGWRIEIKKYPKLTADGAEMPDYTGNSGGGRFYSQNDIREIVAYAAERFITVVPEVDIPGHSKAATTAYPELSCDGKPSTELCVTKPATKAFVDEVLSEVAALFPGPYLHIGGDEVQPDHWKACPTCKKRMDELAKATFSKDVEVWRVAVDTGAGRPFNEDAGRLEGEFVRMLDALLASKGKRMIAWDEVLDGGMTKGSTAVIAAWRGVSAVRGALGQNRDAVVSLYPVLYLDTDTSLKQTYEFEPTTDLADGAEAHILGVQGNMWGESTPAESDVDRRTYPRLCAIAEIGWSPKDSRRYEDFVARLTTHSLRLRAFGILFGIPISQ